MTIEGYIPPIGERDLNKITRSIRNLYENAPDKAYVDSAAARVVTSIASNTGAFTLSHGITNSTNDIRLNVGHLPGETSNGSAAAGEIGEYKETVVLLASAVSLVTDVTSNVASLSLTAGDWDVWGDIVLSSGATTVTTYRIGAISQTSATNPTPPNGGAWVRVDGSVTGGASAFSVGKKRISLSGTTTIYLVCTCGFTTSTNAAYGCIAARRAR